MFFCVFFEGIDFCEFSLFVSVGNWSSFVSFVGTGQFVDPEIFRLIQRDEASLEQIQKIV